MMFVPTGCDALTDASLVALSRYTRAEPLSAPGLTGGRGRTDADVALRVALHELTINSSDGLSGGSLLNPIESPAAAVQR